MKINGLEVTKENFETLLRNVRYCIKALDEGEEEKARWTLEVLEKHLSRNLLADEATEEDVA